MSQIIRGFAWQPWRYQAKGRPASITRTRTVSESVTVTEPLAHWSIEQTTWNSWALRCSRDGVAVDHATLSVTNPGTARTVATITTNGYTVLMTDTLERSLAYLWSLRHE